MRTFKIPDESGWYWCCALVSGEWLMARVNCEAEEIRWWDDEGMELTFHAYDQLEVDKHLGKMLWRGPFVCPGGDFGGHTIELDEDAHAEAAKSKQALFCSHIDYRYLRKEGHGSSITVSGVCSREEADKRVTAEVSFAGKGNPSCPKR